MLIACSLETCNYKTAKIATFSKEMVANAVFAWIRCYCAFNLLHWLEVSSLSLFHYLGGAVVVRVINSLWWTLPDKGGVSSPAISQMVHLSMVDPPCTCHQCHSRADIGRRAKISLETTKKYFLYVLKLKWHQFILAERERHPILYLEVWSQKLKIWIGKKY